MVRRDFEIDSAKGKAPHNGRFQFPSDLVRTLCKGYKILTAGHNDIREQKTYVFSPLVYKHGLFSLEDGKWRRGFVRCDVAHPRVLFSDKQ